MQMLFEYFLGRPFSMNACTSSLMSFWATNFHFVFLLATFFDRYKPVQLQCPTISSSQQTKPYSIRTLELALVAVKYFCKKAPLYIFESVLIRFCMSAISKKRFDFENIFVCRIIQVTFFTLFFSNFIEIS